MRFEEETTVLVVEHDAEARRRAANWLMEAGYTVLACPGPLGPDNVCLGGRGMTCPLAQGAGTVVLDLRLKSDEEMRGAPGWQLMLYYLERGHPVVALGGDEDLVHPWPDSTLALLPRRPSPDELVAAVRDLRPAGRT
jgi:hypothetical protein